MQGVAYGGHTASAPTTPAAWHKQRDTESRSGRLIPASASSSGGRPKHRISADIDQLLSQMSEIDFGEDSEEAVGKATDVTTPPLEKGPEVLHTPRSGTGEAGVDSDRTDKPVSMDLSRLGGLMTMSP